ncbi:MAG: hypothetical protein WCW66_04990 [Patescibacteria group bacterium]|jgi:hypothetical protein
MEESKSFLRTDLKILFAVVLLFSAILAGLVVLDTNTEIINDLSKKIAEIVIK